MKEDEIKKYIDEKIIFSLKDFENTKDKYKDIKTDEFKQFLKDNKKDIKEHIKGLNDFKIFMAFREKNYINNLEFNNKKNIRTLKTWVNSLTYGLNEEFFKQKLKTNNKHIRIFTIKFYIEFYNDINLIMKSSLRTKVLNKIAYINL